VELKKNEQPAAEQRGTESAPLFMKGEVTTKRHDAETKGEAEERKHKQAVDESTLFWASIAATAAGGAALVAAVQMGLFIWQLVLMRKAVADAEDVAKAASTSAAAATNAVQVARAQYVTDQRPWLSLDVEIGGALEYGLDGGEPRWRFTVRYRIKQLGKTPATNVAVFGDLLPFRMRFYDGPVVRGEPFSGKEIPGTDVAAELDKTCQFHESMAEHNFASGHLMFPGEIIEALYGFSVEEPRDRAGAADRGYSGQFLVAFAVTYGSTLSRDRYRTAKAYHLFKTGDSGRIDLRGERIEADNLGMQLHPSNGFIAT
jgi:hypothetical protein